jgi:oligopeptide transport system substrate-binding protein
VQKQCHGETGDGAGLTAGAAAKSAWLLAIAALLLAQAACSRRESPAEAGIRTQTLLVGNGAEPADLDPQSMSVLMDTQIAYTLFEGLTKLDPKTSEAVPALAEGWDTSPDGRVYTFHLRPEGRWSNGDAVTATDFVYSFRRILSPNFASIYSYMLWPIKNAEAYNAGRLADFRQVGVKALGPRTLQVTLERPTPYLPALASHTTWLPVHRATIEKFGRMDEKGTKWALPGNLVGNGAFTLAEWVPNARVSVVRNPMYWDAAHTRLNRIEFYPIEKPDIEDLNYRSGQLHVTYRLPVGRVASYRDHRPVDMRVDPTLSTFYLFFNVTRPPLDNVKLRLALAHALDREALSRDVSRGLYPPARCLTAPDCAGYTCRSGITDDFEEARRFLAEAGYPGGRGLPDIEVQCFQDDVPIRMMEAIQAMWRNELGVRITIAQLETKTLYANQQNKNYSIAFSGWIADYADPSTFLGTMVTGNGNNYAGWSNRAYDRLIDEAAGTADNRVRYELFQRAEAVMLGEAPLIPLFFQPQAYAISPAVHGWTTTVVGIHDFGRVWLGK